MKNTVLFCIILFGLTSVSLAQDGTPLSAKGAGAFTGLTNSSSGGMGNAGLALIGNGYLSTINPATWTGLQNAQFTATYNFSGTSSRDTSIQSSYYANGIFGGAMFALPLDRSLGLSIAGGFAPLTSHEYEISTLIDSSTLHAGYQTIDTNVIGARYLNKGSGGLGEGFVGVSFSPVSCLSLGAMFQYAFGRLESVGTINFNNTAYTSTYSDNSTYMHGSSGTFGFVLDSLDKFIKADFLKGFAFAGYYRTPYHLKGNSELDNLYEDSLYSPFSQSATGLIPQEYGIGIAKSFNDNLIAMLDVRYEAFSKYQDTFTAPGSLRDALFIGAGVESLEGRSFTSLFEKRILRAGFYYQKTEFPVQTKSGQEKQLDEAFVTAGIEFPVSYSATVDISAQYGIRGLSSDFLLHERIFRLYVSITMGEGWFVRAVGD